MSTAKGFVVPAGGGTHFASPTPGRSFAMKLLGRETGDSIMMFEETLPPAGWRADHVEDAWLLLHVLLETLWRYRFLFRDLSGIIERDRRAGQRLASVFDRAVEASHGICLGLVERGVMTATGAEVDALAENIAVVSLYWLSFDSARKPRGGAAGAAMSRGAYQVLMLVAPFLDPAGRRHLEGLAAQYLDG